MRAGRIRSTIAAIAVLAVPGVAHGQSCDGAMTRQAEANIARAESIGLILGSQTTGGRLVVFVDEAVWRGMKPKSRLSFLVQLQCAIAGAGNVLSRLDVAASRSQAVVGRIVNGQPELVTR